MLKTGVRFRVPLLALALSTAVLDAAEPPRTLAPNPEYAAGATHRFFFGNGYRDLWTAPLEVPVLDLGTFAGGLTPVKKGGGFQTRSLRLAGRDGRSYAFRSVDKDAVSVLPEDLRKTLVADIVRDATSSAHPTAALVVAPLLEAAGILHPSPILVVMPDDPALGAFRAEFAGLLGLLEERPSGSGDEAFGGADKVDTTDELFARMRKDADVNVDLEAYLKARLVDLLVGDWDRHKDQWRWARLGEKKGDAWQPVPRDRDQAFSRYDGFLATVARLYFPQLAKFDEKPGGVLELSWNARHLDRRLLSPLPREAYRKAAAELSARFTNAVLEGAVNRLPKAFAERDEDVRLRAFRASHRDVLLRRLTARRDLLPRLADRLYLLHAHEVDVHATDEGDLVSVDRKPGGALEVTLTNDKKAGRTEVFFRRVFDPKETKEVRLYLHGGKDRLTLTGGPGGLPRVRVISEGTVTGAEGLPVYGAAFTPVADPNGTMIQNAYRDWGRSTFPFLWFGFAPGTGLFLGGGIEDTTHAFRKDPYSVKSELRAAFATAPATFKLDFHTDIRAEASRRHFALYALASGIETLAFYGFGNEVPEQGSKEFHRVPQAEFRLEPELILPLGAKSELGLGLAARFTRTDTDNAGRFVNQVRPYGWGSFGRAGAFTRFTWDTRDAKVAARRGSVVTVRGALFPAVWDVDRAFGFVEGSAATYLPLGERFTFALRASGRKVWGTYPFHEAAFLGGADTVRSLAENRYAGDASVFGNAELRFEAGRYFVVLPGTWGLFAAVDSGRVFLRGEHSSQWHTGAGGGLWFAYLEKANTVSLGVLSGKDGASFYARAGFLF